MLFHLMSNHHMSVSPNVTLPNVKSPNLWPLALSYAYSIYASFSSMNSLRFSVQSYYLVQIKYHMHKMFLYRYRSQLLIYEKYILYCTNSTTERPFNRNDQIRSLSLIHIPRFSPVLSHHGGSPLDLHHR